VRGIEIEHARNGSLTAMFDHVGIAVFPSARAVELHGSAPLTFLVLSLGTADADG
jgi:hypothetical protein